MKRNCMSLCTHASVCVACFFSSDKQVIQSLLDISRLCFARFGLEPPQLIKFEFEIAEEEEATAVDEEPESEPEPEPEPEPEVDTTLTQPEQTTPTPDTTVPVAELPTTPIAAQPDVPKPPRYLPYKPKKDDPMDVAVGALVNGNQLDIYIKRVKKGHTKHTASQIRDIPSRRCAC